MRQAVRATLPDYMVPSRIATLDAFPLTPNGKVDRGALPVDQEPDGSAEDTQPQGNIEVCLEALLKRILRLPGIGRHENFFDIGGHSLLAVSYFREIEKIYGIKLALGTLLRGGSIAQLALELKNHDQTRHEPHSLVAIQSEGVKPKLFLVHGAGGNVLFYRGLSRALGGDVPVYGLQSRGLDQGSEPLGSVEAMAKAYVDEIKTVQSTGPYCLGGYCLGGVIAYEMAQVLRRKGDHVALLALLDTYNPARLAPVNPVVYLVQKIYFHVRNLLRVPYAQWRPYFEEKLRIAREGELRLIASSILGDPRVNELSVQERIHQLNVEAVKRYNPQPYSGVVTNFRPRSNYWAFSDPDMGWSGLALGGVKNVELDLDPHAMLVGLFVKHLAERLSTELSAEPRTLNRPGFLRELVN